MKHGIAAAVRSAFVLFFWVILCFSYLCRGGRGRKRLYRKCSSMSRRWWSPGGAAKNWDSKFRV